MIKFTKEEKQEIFDWFLLNFDKYVSCKLYDASGEPININNIETYDDYENYDDYVDIRWDLMEEDFNKTF